MRGFAVILSAPSGTGKTTLAKRLVQRRKDIRPSISCTTRAPRPGEVDGKHYFFLSKRQFKQKIRDNEFLEWAEVHGEWYGTPYKAVNDATKKGQKIVLAIDVQGAMSIRRRVTDAVLIFVLPPSWRALRGRLKRRRDEKESVEKRLRAAKEEVRWADRYDYVVTNDRVPTAARKIGAIIDAESLKCDRQPELLQRAMR